MYTQQFSLWKRPNPGALGWAGFYHPKKVGLVAWVLTHRQAQEAPPLGDQLAGHPVPGETTTAKLIAAMRKALDEAVSQRERCFFWVQKVEDSRWAC